MYKKIITYALIVSVGCGVLSIAPQRVAAQTPQVLEAQVQSSVEAVLLQMIAMLQQQIALLLAQQADGFGQQSDELFWPQNETMNTTNESTMKDEDVMSNPESSLRDEEEAAHDLLDEASRYINNELVGSAYADGYELREDAHEYLDTVDYALDGDDIVTAELYLSKVKKTIDAIWELKNSDKDLKKYAAYEEEIERIEEYAETLDDEVKDEVISSLQSKAFQIVDQIVIAARQADSYRKLGDFDGIEKYLDLVDYHQQKLDAVFDQSERSDNGETASAVLSKIDDVRILADQLYSLSGNTIDVEDDIDEVMEYYNDGDYDKALDEINLLYQLLQLQIQLAS